MKKMIKNSKLIRRKAVLVENLDTHEDVNVEFNYLHKSMRMERKKRTKEIVKTIKKMFKEYRKEIADYVDKAMKEIRAIKAESKTIFPLPRDTG